MRLRKSRRLKLIKRCMTMSWDNLKMKMKKGKIIVIAVKRETHHQNIKI